MNKDIKTVDEYMSLQPEKVIEALERLRQIIKTLAPEMEEIISYGMPMYKYKGMLVGFAAFKNHLSFFPGGVVEYFKAELKDFKIAKGTIQFTVERPIPEALIKKIILFRMGENEAKWEAKEIKNMGVRNSKN